MLVWRLEPRSTGEKLSSLALALGQTSHFPLDLIVSWARMIIHIIHNASIFGTHAVSGRLRLHLLLLRVIPARRRVIVGFFLQIPLGNSNLLRLGVLQCVILRWRWRSLHPVVYLSPSRVADSMTCSLSIGSQTPSIIDWSWTCVILLRHLEDRCIIISLLFLWESGSLNAGEVR